MGGVAKLQAAELAAVWREGAGVGCLHVLSWILRQLAFVLLGCPMLLLQNEATLTGLSSRRMVGPYRRLQNLPHSCAKR